MNNNPGGAVSLLGLPSLFLRSMFTVAGLYALLVVCLIALVEYYGFDLTIAVGLGIIVILLQFLLGPWLMDLQLRWMFNSQAVSPDQIPEHLKLFIERICQKHQMKYPRLILINDDAPQAFTYGHTPNNARVVISEGILRLLKPEEIEAVVAHELGHAIHWDMLLMTTAQIVPLLLYYLYKTMIRSGNNKNKGVTLTAAIVLYLLYIICEYIVLFFSRTREYHADRFAGWETGDPAYLTSALVKIAYGLAGQDDAEESSGQRNPRMAAISAMGIFDVRAAQALAISSYPGPNAQTNQANIKGAMCWDLWNPWASWYELNSTHPLVANRLRYLSNQSLHMGLAPYIVFDQVKPESYWDEFLVDMLVYFLPLLMPLGLLLAVYLQIVPGLANIQDKAVPPLLCIALGLALLIRYVFSYPENEFPETNVAGLLNQVKVSNVRPVACTLKGKVIGRGVPGYIFSEDFVLQDETGIIFMDLSQPLGIWEFLFAIFITSGLIGREVVVTGWYHRAPVPYVELYRLTSVSKEYKSYVPVVKKTFVILLILGGLIWSFMGM